MRHKDSHRKFLLGLSFEKAGIALANKEYLSSESALQICQFIMTNLEQESDLEHKFYRQGEQLFGSKTFMKDNDPTKAIQALFGEDWKRTRYHSLVRLGGDVLRSGLADYPMATILGALCWHANRANT